MVLRLLPLNGLLYLIVPGILLFYNEVSHAEQSEILAHTSFHCTINNNHPNNSDPKSSDSNEITPLSNTEYSPLIDHTHSTSSTGSTARWQLLANNIIHQLVGDDVHSSLGSYPNLRINMHHFPNAFARTQNKMTISSGLISHLDSSEEFAFIIAHELGHLFLKHTEMQAATTMEEFIAREKEADKYALKLLQQSHFDQKRGTKILHKLANFQVSDNTTLAAIYPSLSDRIRELEQQ